MTSAIQPARLVTAIVGAAVLTIAMTGVASTASAVTETVFAVETSEDSGLATPTGTTCVDAASGDCSLRAAVQAANNLDSPVQIQLDATTFTLSDGTLDVSNPAGTSIVGFGSDATTISGGGTQGILKVTALANAAGGELIVTGVTLTAGKAADGGALDLDDTNAGTTAILAEDLVSGNTATTAGGAVYAAGDDALYLTGTTIQSNVAPKGGGIWAASMDGQFTDSHIEANTTTVGQTGFGGGIYVSHGVINMLDGSIDSNVAGDGADAGFGGAVYDAGSAELTFSGVSITGNSADDGGEGGAIYADDDLVDIAGGSISDNNVGGSGGDGGGVFVDDGSQIGLHGVDLEQDTVDGTAAAGHGGGAIFAAAGEFGIHLRVDDASTIASANNSAVDVVADGGGADVTIQDTQLAENTDGSSNVTTSGSPIECGAAVCADAAGDGGISLNMNEDQVTDNTTSGGTDAPGAVGLVTASDATVAGDFVGDTFNDNSVGAAGSGGAIAAIGGDSDSPLTVTTNADSFTANTAGTTTSNGDGSGGALALTDNVTYLDNGSSFSNNQAIGTGGFGGAVVANGSRSAEFDGTHFTNNSADSDSGYGGAIYTDDPNGDLFNHAIVTSNTAWQGGGIYSGAVGAQLSISNSTIASNTAGSNFAAGIGAGIDDADSLLSLTNSTLADNDAVTSTTAPGQGGGIWVGGGRADLRYVTVAANTAAAGAGIYEDGAGGSLLSSIVDDNVDADSVEADCDAAAPASAFTSVGGNVIGLATCLVDLRTSDTINTHAGLEPLNMTGGPTKTEKIDASSPARDRGSFDCPTTDQRGQPRSSSVCDAGAYQFAAGTVTKISASKGEAGNVLSLTGTGFKFARTVDFGSEPAVHFTINSNTRITVTVPSVGKLKKNKTVRVMVSSFDGASTTKAFTYQK